MLLFIIINEISFNCQSFLGLNLTIKTFNVSRTNGNCSTVISYNRLNFHVSIIVALLTGSTFVCVCVLRTEHYLTEILIEST